MSGAIQQSGRLRALFIALALCVLALRVLVPTGYMPTKSAHGILIELCTGTGQTQTVMLDTGKAGGKSDPADHQKGADSPCPFAAGLGGGLMAMAAMILPPVIPIRTTSPISAAIADLTVHRLAAPPPPSQAPPRA